jgi:hypothetical protein
LSNPRQPLFLINSNFSNAHQHVLTVYLQDERRLTIDMWHLLYEAIKLLDQSVVQIDQVRYTFRQVYNQYIDQALADNYIDQLVSLTDPARQFPALTATFARQIAPILDQAQLRSRNIPQSFLLFAYCVYWWQSFARGYAFEVEIKRDLEASQIAFTMHDIRSRAERYSQADLVVLAMMGDIKTSIYFLQESSERSLPNDFYITRLYEQGHARTLVVFQKPFAWRRIGGGVVAFGELENVLKLLPQPVQVIESDTVLIVVTYETWKELVRQTQEMSGGSND